MTTTPFIGCAGWAIRKEHAPWFPANGSHLERYSSVFDAVEINSSFYKPHQRKTYERWGSSVPDTFRFAVKVPKALTHGSGLSDPGLVEPFLSESSGLGEKLFSYLIQLPPSLQFERTKAEAVFRAFRERFTGYLVCEPRHPSWWSKQAKCLFSELRVDFVHADPPIDISPNLRDEARSLLYLRLHGSPTMYSSAYSEDFLSQIRKRIIACSLPCICIFDNTATGAASLNAIELRRLFP